MGRQFQLETIPRFQWRVIVEVCSGLAQTKLDSTNFWVIECDVRFGVKSAVLTVGQSLPIYPDKQTFSESDGMSQMCHKQSSHNATFGDTARLADDSGLSDWSGDTRTRDAALRHANRLAIDDGIGWTSTHGDANKEREPSA
jgi:hypothetical protein